MLAQLESGCSGNWSPRATWLSRQGGQLEGGLFLNLLQSGFVE